ncbi:MAG TPA: lytic transglycosylase domain-containing protein [Thermohalobaculum sp.]|nr:lytic transglycosylase domain-containing protein [Thermohalobaculum sp.]
MRAALLALALLAAGGWSLSAAPDLPEDDQTQTDQTQTDPPQADPAQADPPEEASGPAGAERLCTLIERAAGRHGLPAPFLARLIWLESRFDARAVSPKGALGVAQFMPATAARRGLADPFDPDLAIPAAAAYLAELRAEFGNLGLAAAAYNSGESRVAA